MTTKIVLGAGVINQTPLDWKGNLLRITQLVNDAHSKKIDILCLPELSLCGYGCEDQFLSNFTIEKSWESLLKLSQTVSNTLVWVGLPVLFQGQLYNVAACLYNHQIQALIPKQFLANDGVHYEPRWFKPWPQNQREIFVKDGLSVPMGDYRIQFGELCLGIEICQDAWEGVNRPAHALAERGVSIICNPTASHFSFGKSVIRQHLAIEGSKIIGGAYVFANLLGNESGRIIFDGDAYIVHQDKIVAQTQRFSFRDSELIFAELELDKLISNGEDVLVVEKVHHSHTNVAENFDLASWEISDYKKEEEFARAISLGLWDYMRKSYSNGWVISLSGGADSSAIASLCYLSLQLASKDLSFEQIQQKLSFIPWISEVSNVSELTSKILTTMYQGTKNSSQDTRDSAKKLADFIQSTHCEIEIDDLVDGYRGLIEGVLQRELTWELDDVTLQNVQARVRSPSIWMLANIKNALLLATSNRSEASVGYATMDGDTSGSISPIAGIDKSFIRTWLKWLEYTGLDNELKVLGLSSVNQLEPSAELRPLASKQIDEEDLMPYPILNSIERWAFYHKLSPKECFRNLVIEYGNQFSEEKLMEFCQRYFRLWARNQWKRERYAPGFHVDDYSLDPKSWLRFPILSGGLEKDLF
ncbi:NAD(+) synthase [Aquirufa sp. ROCK2-A2]